MLFQSLQIITSLLTSGEPDLIGKSKIHEQTMVFLVIIHIGCRNMRS